MVALGNMSGSVWQAVDYVHSDEEFFSEIAPSLMKGIDPAIVDACVNKVLTWFKGKYIH